MVSERSVSYTGSDDRPVTDAREVAAFDALQSALPEMFRAVFPDDRAERTIVILPSLSLDMDVLAKIEGAHHYEERMLCMLLLLRLPRTRVIYLSSEPVADTIIDYYLHLLPGIPARHARRRLTLLSCHDASLRPLTAKILERPRLLEKLSAAVGDTECAHMSCFTVSELERCLAVRLGIPIYGCDPALLHLGTKSGSRKLFREAGMAVPDGAEDLRDDCDIADALTTLKSRRARLRRAVVKLNDGFSGEGNAVLDFHGAPERKDLLRWVRDRLPDLAFEARDMSWEAFRGKVAEMGAVVEVFVEGVETRSPSAQYRVDPAGDVQIISTHDQVLGGEAGQVFLGCRFPADEAYRLTIQNEGLKAARLLAKKGVLGRFGIDFVSAREDGRSWTHYGIEVNLRKGGTTHPFLMLQFLTDGVYEPETGLYRTRAGKPCFYYASDNLHDPKYRGLTPDDLVDIAAMNGLHFHAAAHQGVVFHLIGALSEYGKLGVMCISGTVEGARDLYGRTVSVLDRETSRERQAP